MPSSKFEHLFVVPPSSRDELIESLTADLAQAATGDLRRNVITAAESAAAAEVAVMARLSVLMRTYQGEYHTDSFDVGRLADRIRAGDESIVFWGAESEVDRLREAFAQGAEAPALNLGTSTTMSSEQEWGPGHAELTRNGSMDSTVGAKAVYLWQRLQHLTGEDGGTVHGRYHTVMGACRNRASTPEIRGGEAMHRIGVRYLRTGFWGYIPFYVMQGNVLELTELREYPRDPEDVWGAVRTGPSWYFADRAEADYAKALLELNGCPEPDIGVGRRRVSSAAPRYDLLLPASPSLFKTNHATVLPTETGGYELDAAVTHASDCGVCCCAVRLDLWDPGSVEAQQWLLGNGFRLTAVSPPKNTWVITGGIRRTVRSRPTGIWTRPNSDLDIAPPYYAQWPVNTATEARIMDYLNFR